MNNLDKVAEVAPPGMRVQGLLDAAALVDIYPAGNGWSWSNDLTPLQTLVGAVAALVNPVLPASCTARYPGAEWKCMRVNSRP